MSTVPAGALPAGTVLAGRYRIEAPLAQGGMGAVYEATQLSLSRRVAIKVLKPALAQDEEMILRFQREVEAVARLQHPNIVGAIDAGRSDDGTLFLAMELVQGRTLRKRLQEQGPLPWTRTFAIVEDLAEGLAAAHSEGIIHRDLKAENILLCTQRGRSDTAKILDFGVAKLVSRPLPQDVVTGLGLLAGTPGTIAPEQMKGQADDPRSDLYALGVVWFEMLTGRAPFIAPSSAELLVLHLTEPAPRVEDAFPLPPGAVSQIPSAVGDLVACLLEKDPRRRPHDAKDVLSRLEALRDAGLPTAPSTPRPNVPAPPAAAGFSTRVVAVPPPTAKDVPTPAPELHRPIGADDDDDARAGDATVTDPDRTPIFPRARNPAPATLVDVGNPTLPTTSTVNVPVARPPALQRGWAVAVAVALLMVPVVAFVWLRDGDRTLRWSADAPAAAALARAADHLLLLEVDAAKRQLTLALQRDPENALAYTLLAFTLREAAVPRAYADEPYRKASALLQSKPPKDPRARLLLRALTDLDNATATAAAADYLERYTASDVERALLAQRFIFADTPAQSEVRFRACMEVTPWPLCAVGLSNVLREAKNDAEARRVLEASLAEAPATTPLVHALVSLDVAQGDLKAARDRLQAVTNPDDFVSRLRLASLDAWLGAPDPFPALVDDASKIADADQRAAAVFRIARRMGSLGRAREAHALIVELLRSAPPAVQLQLGGVAVILFSALDDWPHALQLQELQREAFAALDPNDPAAARTRPFVYGMEALTALQRGDVPGARARYDLLARAPGDAPALVEALGWRVALAEGRRDVALALIEQEPACLRHISRATVALLHDKDAAQATAAADQGVAARFVCTSSDTDLADLNVIFTVEAAVVRAELARRAGDEPKTLEMIAVVRSLWPHADADAPFMARVVALERGETPPSVFIGP